ncbi:acyltransferase family protein [Ruminococcus flavefaciens]|uniref:Peptidoglycan/LPS O-acetylase OafA/YrhL n=1 Tax=Ruminococcus flavefaciens TaxID=1265 RepID=A0A315XY63_RUMFL|nr:acyltransferase [Ruminococcus flavefaciens]PWJ11783.1 peptidoglycan/LPS O-acetylase OafA/YrhL [Ruminococcus flavefaciens]SSA49970.1 Peptidoglycan/LPS O-acetylase OafA/YrhL, contains acyltransferase and SGNH-hydrolase domains [Ruminococcus flavefaciens]
MFDIDLFTKYRKQLMGFAIVWVMILHCYSKYLRSLGVPVLSFLSEQGNLGVEIFLFLSGIGLYFSMNKNSEIIPFYWRRIKRVIIPWLIISCPYWILKSIIVDHDGAMVFLENWSGISLWTKGITTVWYVSFIIVLYLLYPFLYRLQKKSPLLIMLLMAAVIAANVVMVKCCSDFYEAREKAFSRIPIFLVGSLIGERIKNKDMDRRKQFFFLGYAALMLAAYIPGVLRCNYDIDIMPLSVGKMLARFGGQGAALFVIILLCLLFDKVKMTGVKKGLAFLGGITLEIYLIHVFLSNIISRTNFVDNKGYPFKFAIMTAVVVMSVIVAWIFSKIYNSIVDRLENKKTAA